MPLVKANPGSKTRRAHWSQGADMSRRTRRQEDGESQQLAWAMRSFHCTSPFLYLKCFTTSLSVKLWKQISVVNDIDNGTV